MDERLLERYGSPKGADAYRRKYEKSRLRKMSGRRELRLVERALSTVGVGGLGLHEVLDVPCGAGRLASSLAVKGRVGQSLATAISNTLDVATIGPGTVTSSAGGINCGADCTQAYNAGAPVTLTATPNAASRSSAGVEPARAPAPV